MLSKRPFEARKSLKMKNHNPNLNINISKGYKREMIKKFEDLVTQSKFSYAQATL